MKKESYLAYKYPRGINSRSDSFKIWSGPLFRAIEHRLFQHEAFIKHIPQKERTTYIKDLLEGTTNNFATDFTSFESSFTADVQDALECVLYDYMLKALPDSAKRIRDAIGGKNVCKYHGFSITTRATRMSGDMCTSLGNGFSNLMLVTFVAAQKGGTVRGVVEGDDGLFGSSVPITGDDFKGLGFDIKLINIMNFRTASFCGLVVGSDGTALCEPRKTILKFGWSLSALAVSDRLKPMLLKAKSMSLMYEFPRCPIVTELAKLGLRLTNGLTPRFEKNWRQYHMETEVLGNWELTEAEADMGVTDDARHAFAELYGINVELQLAIEEEIRGWSCGPLLPTYAPQLFATYGDCAHYYERYVAPVGTPEPDLVGAVTFADIDQMQGLGLRN